MVWVCVFLRISHISPKELDAVVSLTNVHNLHLAQSVKQQNIWRKQVLGNASPSMGPQNVHFVKGFYTK